MKLRVLGCSGGIGGAQQRTTSLLIDDDVLIDAGTGLGDLSVAELAAIDHVFLTHSHLDHIAHLPLMIDTVADRRQTPLTVHGLPAVLENLRRHVFNWAIWPDFAEVPSADQPFLRYQSLAVGEMTQLGTRRISALPVDHGVPAVAYRLDSGDASLVFSGDTGPCPAFWQAVNQIDNLRYLIIECAFPNRERELALRSSHLCPQLLAHELTQLEQHCELFITHLKPGQAEQTMREIEHELAGFQPRMLHHHKHFAF